MSNNIQWDTSWGWFLFVNGLGSGSPPGSEFIITEDLNKIITEDDDNVVTE